MNSRLLFFIFLAFVTLTSFARADDDLLFSQHLPEPDRAEVHQENGPAVQLGERDARALAKLLRAQTWQGPQGSCRDVQYILKFYADHKLIVSEGICFNCGCLRPEGTDLQGFKTNTPEAIAMQKFLEKFFRKGTEFRTETEESKKFSLFSPPCETSPQCLALFSSPCELFFHAKNNSMSLV